MTQNISRRTLLGSSILAAGLHLAGRTDSRSAVAAQNRPKSEPFGYCLNMGTIRGQNLSLVEEIETAAKAGYDGIEPWSRKIDAYVKEGGSLADLRKRIADLGLTVESAIAFSQWIVDDDTKRAQGLEDARRNMDALAQIGGTRIAAPPAGRHRPSRLESLQGGGTLPRAARIGRRNGRHSASGSLGFFQSTLAVGRDSLRRRGKQPPQRLYPARRVSHLQRGLGVHRFENGGGRIDPRLPRQ